MILKNKKLSLLLILFAILLILIFSLKEKPLNPKITIAHKTRFTIYLTGPDEIVQAYKNYLGISYGGCYYDVDWGDSSVVVQDPKQKCPSLTHTYAKSGTYTIKTHTWSLATNDGGANYREKKLKIDIE